MEMGHKRDLHDSELFLKKQFQIYSNENMLKYIKHIIK